MFRLVTDVSSEDEVTPAKLRYSIFATLEDAVVQAEHELATDAAKERHLARTKNVLHPSGVRPLRIEDEAGNTVWEP